VWIPYTLMAVPIITSFAGQTIASVVSVYQSYYQRHAGQVAAADGWEGLADGLHKLSNFFRPACSKETIERTVRDTPEAFKPHSDYIIHSHQVYRDIRRTLNEQRRACRVTWVQVKPDDGEKDGVGVISPACRPLPIDNANPYPYECGASTHPPVQHRRNVLGFHPQAHRRPVQREVAELVLKDAEEQFFPECREEQGVTAQKQMVRSDQHTVELIVKAKADEDDPSKLGTRGDANVGGLEDPPGRVDGIFHDVHEENVGNRPKSHLETQECDDQESGEAKENAKEEAVRELESHLLRKLVELMVRLETEARQMLLDSMEKGLVRTLLLADRNGELRTAKVNLNDKRQRAGTNLVHLTPRSADTRCACSAG
jgi:potassium channel subfamily K